MFDFWSILIDFGRFLKDFWSKLGLEGVLGGFWEGLGTRNLSGSMRTCQFRPKMSPTWPQLGTPNRAKIVKKAIIFSLIFWHRFYIDFDPILAPFLDENGSVALIQTRFVSQDPPRTVPRPPQDLILIKNRRKSAKNRPKIDQKSIKHAVRRSVQQRLPNEKKQKSKHFWVSYLTKIYKP